VTEKEAYEKLEALPHLFGYCYFSDRIKKLLSNKTMDSLFWVGVFWNRRQEKFLWLKFWITEHEETISSPVTFEQVLEFVEDEVKEDLLFHLDLFT
jgi:predicted CopG family antitoxin